MRPTLTLTTLTLLLSSLLTGCAHTNAPAPLRHEVVVLGMIHSGHTTSERYSTDQLARIIRRIDPDVVLCEIPPERLPIAEREFEQTGEITEARVRVFPEYVDVLFPLTREMDFEMIGCAAWTRKMANTRSALLTEWRTSRHDDTERVNSAMGRIDQQINTVGHDDDPLLIHTDQYDEWVREGMAPYQDLFGDDLGPGGWDSINAAHYALIEGALDALPDTPQRVLITFGSWHKYWFLDRLRERGDVIIIDARDFMR